MIVSNTQRALIFTLFSLFAVSSGDPQAYRLNFSPNVYGPDGPWHAVRVGLGTPPQQVDLYPATWYATWPLTHSVCNGKTSTECLAEKGGFYDPTKSSTFNLIPPKFAGDEETEFARNNYNNFGDILSATGSLVTGNETLHFTPDNSKLSVPESGLEYLKSASFRAGGGATYPFTLGYLTLGAGLLNTLFASGPRNTFHVAYSYLYSHKIIPSPSWTLHIGSPSLGIEPSMYLGGYDENRVIGDQLAQLIPYTAQSFNNLAVNISNIAIATAEGESPFINGDQNNLLSKGGASTDQINIEPAVPYLFLPTETCRNIAAHLPVKFQEDYGLYLWDTESPHYKRIMASAGYLSFSLQAAFSSGNYTVEIKVPFQLLNLTLSSPITNPPVAYFPCSPVDDHGTVALGRAFLQATFIGVNWYLPQPRSWWFLAQAPGPGLKQKPIIRNIYPLDHGLFTSSIDWKSSWADYWKSVAKPLPSKKSSGLSTGAEAGIGVGVAVACLIIIGIIIFIIYKRRQRSKDTERSFSPELASSTTGTYVSEPTSFAQSTTVLKSSSYTPVRNPQKAELEQPKVYHELPSHSQTHELPS